MAKSIRKPFADEIAPRAIAVEQPDRQTLAQAVVRVSEGMRKLSRSGLNRKAIVVLLQHSTKVSNKQVNAVLDGLDTLAKEYCE